MRIRTDDFYEIKPGSWINRFAWDIQGYIDLYQELWVQVSPNLVPRSAFDQYQRIECQCGETFGYNWPQSVELPSGIPIHLLRVIAGHQSTPHCRITRIHNL